MNLWLSGAHTATTYIQCSPLFFGSPHLDCAIINMQNSPIFDHLILLFKCHIADEDYDFALVQPYDVPDKHLNFGCVCARPCASSEIFLVKSIIHGVALAEDSTKLGDFLVIDTIDTDMFLHMQVMHNTLGH
ncbi:hypothetical protein PAXRUDRAFT_177985 [Paxillus rubicundulus Ve08.2h10]|uniref:Uncharacterized protein n=1 Tax=Paxillus rubicundulus Ve08.2h10 TaxID=930991 RepID=A0A0D0CDG1_9AGAM|nr:hypothetical protein PAXRUDRAFT_177985 [Paxillus rubicundulus Ve08.2h10]